MYTIRILTVLLFFVTGLNVTAQDNRLLVKSDGKPAPEFLKELSLQSGVSIIYSENLVQKLPDVTLHLKGVGIDEILTEVLRGTKVSFRYLGDQIVLFDTDPEILKFTISGVVTDSSTGEPLISAYVFDQISGKGTQTNDYGYYSLNLPQGNVNLVVGYLGYTAYKANFYLNVSRMMPIHLPPSVRLPEIVITSDRSFNPDSGFVPHPDLITLSQLQNNIQLGGSSDLYRAADFIPGVHTGTDGVGGIHVRGGANDQNLILMDGVPVYHPNHLLGIISVFNYQVIQQASIYKANFPSRFSGRLSSVMDVRTREGNINDWSFSGNLGASEFGLMAEGPIVKEKIGVLFSGRFFLPGLFMQDITRAIKEKNGVTGFADIDYLDFNGKINWKLGVRDRLYLSVYRGSDRFSDFTITKRNVVDHKTGIRVVSHEEFDKNLNWTNKTAILRWNHIVNDKIFANLILSTSSFVLQSVDRSEFDFTFPNSEILPISGFDTKEFKSGITDITAKIELDIRPSPDHQLSGGLYGIDYTFQPKSITINEESKIGNFYLNEGLLDDAYFASFKVRALETGVYLEDKWDIQEGLQLTSGLHISTFFVQQTYYLDPQLRMTLDYQPFEKLAFNIGYSRMAQYLHNLTSSSIGLPTDLWVPTTKTVSPALSDQYVFSALWKPSDVLWFDMSAYIKDMRSVISYQEGASFLIKEGLLQGSIVDAGNWEKRITTGTGDASGIELQANYEYKKLKFKVNGTWSRSYRIFEEINDGKPFPDRYDRRWSSTFTSQLKLSPRFSTGVNFVYGSGIAITLAESKFFNPGSFFPQVGINYSERNGFRLPPYHRMDINFNYILGAKKGFNHSLALNLYNVYNRTNPFYITLVQDPLNQVFEFKQFSLFKFFPTVSYRFTLQ